jgi:hypothetical protein
VGLVVGVVGPGCDSVVVGLLVQVPVDALGGPVQGRGQFSAEGVKAVDVRSETWREKKIQSPGVLIEKYGKKRVVGIFLLAIL